MSHQEDVEACDLDERVATPQRRDRNRSPEEAFPYLRIPQLTVAGRPQISKVKSISPTNKSPIHGRKRSISHEIELYRRKMTKDASLRPEEDSKRRYPWLTPQAERRLAEIERQIIAKIAVPPVLKTKQTKSKTLKSELTRLWTSLSLSKKANYLDFISVLTELSLIQGSEVTLINSLWAAAGGDENQGVTKEELIELLEKLQTEAAAVRSTQDETRCSDESAQGGDSEGETPVRRARTLKRNGVEL